MVVTLRARALTLLFASGAFVAITVGAGGCKPKVGGKCQSGQAVCEDSANVLACQGETFLEARCRGPGGCTKLGSKITCDDAIAEAGEACLENETDNRACSVDKTAVLACQNGTFKLAQTCRGPKGCGPHGDTPTCDATLALKGDPCAKVGDSACAPDQKSRLLCKDGKWAFDRFCRGARGCTLPAFECDEEISDVGDPCGTAGYVACGVDHASELVCQGGQYFKARDCKKGCLVARGRVDCQN